MYLNQIIKFVCSVFVAMPISDTQMNFDFTVMMLHVIGK